VCPVTEKLQMLHAEMKKSSLEVLKLHHHHHHHHHHCQPCDLMGVAKKNILSQLKGTNE